MATLTRPYLIRRRDGTGAPRMVEASSQAAALRHVAVDTYAVEVPSAIEAIRLMQTGVEIETVKVEQLTIEPEKA